MSTRYKTDKEFLNNSSTYSEIFDSKQIKNIKSYQMLNFNLIDEKKYYITYHYVTNTDKLYNLSSKYYGTPEYWWVIGLINNIKSDFELVEGAYIKILNPISSLLNDLVK